MRRANSLFFGIFVFIFAVAFLITACDNGTTGEQETAIPYPVMSVEDVNRSMTTIWNNPVGLLAIETTSNIQAHLRAIYGDDDSIPPDIQGDVLGFSMNWGKVGSGNSSSLTLVSREFEDMSDVVLHEYTVWREPKGLLSLTEIELTADSVINMVTTKLGFNAAYKGIGVSGSIEKESGTVVTKMKGTEVQQTWDLTKYDQSKLYKIVLIGEVTGIRHEYNYIGPADTPKIVTKSPYYSVDIDESSLRVRLVHN